MAQYSTFFLIVNILIVYTLMYPTTAVSCHGGKKINSPQRRHFGGNQFQSPVFNGQGNYGQPGSYGLGSGLNNQYFGSAFPQNQFQNFGRPNQFPNMNGQPFGNFGQANPNFNTGLGQGFPVNTNNPFSQFQQGQGQLNNPNLPYPNYNNGAQPNSNPGGIPYPNYNGYIQNPQIPNQGGQLPHNGNIKPPGPSYGWQKPHNGDQNFKTNENNPVRPTLPEYDNGGQGGNVRNPNPSPNQNQQTVEPNPTPNIPPTTNQHTNGKNVNPNPSPNNHIVPNKPTQTDPILDVRKGSTTTGDKIESMDKSEKPQPVKKQETPAWTYFEENNTGAESDKDLIELTKPDSK